MIKKRDKNLITEAQPFCIFNRYSKNGWTRVLFTEKFKKNGEKIDLSAFLMDLFAAFPGTVGMVISETPISQCSACMEA